MHALVTGGAGFIGCNLAARLLREGFDVTVLDNLSRPGARKNAAWLAGLHDPHLHMLTGDVRDASTVQLAVEGQSVVFHLAAQVAVTKSIIDPREDLGVNLLGTMNVLEAARALPPNLRPAIIFTSTNKVYGEMTGTSIRLNGRRYIYSKLRGVSEDYPLDFHSPYGCSKGAADQYVRDYARIYGLSTVVFRMSCIYGPHQYGNEDQGWVAHFLMSALFDKPITIYGDGKQVRDVLYVEDLIDAFLAALNRINAVRGQVFNIGGGAENTISLLELLDWLATQPCSPPRSSFQDWRAGDQPVYISDIRKANDLLKWMPRTIPYGGFEKLWDWIEHERKTLAEIVDHSHHPRTSPTNAESNEHPRS